MKAKCHFASLDAPLTERMVNADCGFFIENHRIVFAFDEQPMGQGIDLKAIPGLCQKCQDLYQMRLGNSTFLYVIAPKGEQE